MTSLTVTLTPVDTSRAPAEVQIRKALKELLRTHGIRAKWPEPESIRKALPDTPPVFDCFDGEGK